MTETNPTPQVGEIASKKRPKKDPITGADIEYETVTVIRKVRKPQVRSNEDMMYLAELDQSIAQINNELVRPSTTYTDAKELFEAREALFNQKNKILNDIRSARDIEIKSNRDKLLTKISQKKVNKS